MAAALVLGSHVFDLDNLVYWTLVVALLFVIIVAFGGDE